MWMHAAFSFRSAGGGSTEEEERASRRRAGLDRPRDSLDAAVKLAVPLLSQGETSARVSEVAFPRAPGRRWRKDRSSRKLSPAALSGVASLSGRLLAAAPSPQAVSSEAKPCPSHLPSS